MSGLRPVMNTFAPTAVIACAVARPMPLDPPVMITRLPSRYMMAPPFLTVARRRGLLRRGGIVRREERAPRLFVHLLLEHMILPDGVRPRRCRSGVDRLEPAL